ncbi:MAG: hypothetical protein IPM12_16680 [Flavobacteriales bacterium]|nr:hypothetical protein [Flavobacteriales bacterium]
MAARVALGGTGFTSGPIFDLAMALNAAGDPVVAYRDVATQTVVAQRWNGSSWTMLGGGPLSVTNSSSPSVAMDAQGDPVVVLMRRRQAHREALERPCMGAHGLPGFTAVFAQLPQLVLGR